MRTVTIIQENCVNRMFSFEDVKKAEQCFTHLVKANSSEHLDEEEIEDFLMDGFCECENGSTICIGEPETEFDETLI
jgi:hypothetical protein